MGRHRHHRPHRQRTRRPGRDQRRRAHHCAGTDRRADAAGQSAGRVLRSQLRSESKSRGWPPSICSIGSCDRFAYVGSEDRAWSQRRETAFYNYLTERGFSPHIYRQPKRPRDREWEREQAYLAKWISELPTPIGLFACDDDRGREVLEACSLAGLHVPEDVAVVGVDNDEVFCELSDPPLSSVAVNAESAGYRAAALLDGMMRGRVRKPQRIVVEALGVVTRRSTEIVAVEDADIATALRFIHREQGHDISVESVVREVAVSRRNLEKRFRNTIGRTILEEIQLVRLERAKRLLIETTYPVSKVADMAGFGSAGYFIQFFQKRVGKTPRKYRMHLIP